MLLPHLLYLPSRLQDVLFCNFHTIHSRADLADMLFDWEFIDSDSDIFGLFNVIQKCNEVFDKEHTTKKAVCEQKAAATHQMKAAVASATCPAGMSLYFWSSSYIHLLQFIADILGKAKYPLQVEKVNETTSLTIRQQETQSQLKPVQQVAPLSHKRWMSTVDENTPQSSHGKKSHRIA